MNRPPPDPVLFLALVNSAAKDALGRARRFERGSAQNLEWFARSCLLYEAKSQAAARLAYAGVLRFGLLDRDTRKPCALLIGYSPALGYHAFHLPVPPHTWALGLPTTNARSRYGSRQRLEHAARKAPPLEEMLDALAALPPLPPAVAVAWGMRRRRPSWREIEDERANAPAGVPRHQNRKKRRSP